MILRENAGEYQKTLAKRDGFGIIAENRRRVRREDEKGDNSMDGTTAAGGGLSMIIWLVAMFGVLYFFMIRPENKRKKQAQAMRDSLKKGDKVTTIGGIIGKIVHVTDDVVVLETSDDRVRVEVAKWAISSTGVQTTEQPAETKEASKLNGETLSDDK